MEIVIITYLALVALVIQYIYTTSGGQADMRWAIFIALPVAAILPLAVIIHAIYGDD